MPSGLRYRITHNGTQVDLSPEQFDLLNKKSIRLPRVPEWKLEQRLKGLVTRGLFHKRNGSFVRTKIGSEVLQALKTKSKSKSKSKSTNNF